MKFFVTGLGGQLGHGVVNELAKRGHMGVGSDMAPAYSAWHYALARYLNEIGG